MKPILKKFLPHLISFLAIVAVSSIYFSPAWEGQTLQQDDVVKGKGSVAEKYRYKNYEDKQTLWNNSIFSGMPEFLGAQYKGATKLWYIWEIQKKLGIPTEVSFLIWYMLGFYILLVLLNVNPWLALAGAISFGLTSYNLVLVNAGHFMKVRTIALVAPVLGGVYTIFRRKYLAGLGITALFLAMQINMGHVQMSYYFMLGLICIGFTELYFHYRNKELIKFSKSVGILILAAVLGIAPNFAKLINYYEYNKQTIRGKSELTLGKEEVKTSSGLDRDYINMWSSGRSESMMLFAPNVKGGASAYVRQDRDMLRKIEPRLRETIGSMNQYWGDQSPVSGSPNSAGAVIAFLFIVGMFLIKGPLKYGVLFSVVLYILLSWGEHFASFTNLFIDYVPLYNKFRAPVSILGIAVIFITFFAFYTVSQITSKPELLEEKSRIKVGNKNMPLYLAAGLGFIVFLLLNILFPGLFHNFMSDSEIGMFNNYRAQGNAGQIDTIIQALEDLRKSVFKAEFIRTLLFSGTALASMVLLQRGTIKRTAFIAILSILAIIDVWSIGQRYVNKDDFTKKRLIAEEYKLSPIDKQIHTLEIQENPLLRNQIDEAFEQYKPKTELEKEDLQSFIVGKNTFYRVYNLTQSPFNENYTANAHRSVGGYHAAKLRRYQDLIEHHIGKGNMSVLNMLNTKYIISQNGLQVNTEIPGPAWFVDSVIWAKNADEEILALNKIELNKAVISEKDKHVVGEFQKPDSDDFIRLEKVDADYVKYKSFSNGSRLAVFSEIYYPGWTVLIDGKEAEYFTTNYVLRGMIIPEGEHDIEFIFKPAYYYWSNTVSQFSFYVLIFILLGVIIMQGRHTTSFSSLLKKSNPEK